MRYTCRAGFSLVELSIVLVILGLLVGGILGGQSLIRAAELRTITTDAERYRTAVFNFRQKYHSLPGDTLLAERLWGKMDSCPPEDNYTPSPARLTCNGDGDGLLGPNPDIYDVGSNRTEWFGFWQHLANAGLISGNYTGVHAPNTSWGGHIAGENCPRSRFNSAACWGVLAVPDSGATGDGSSGQTSYGTFFEGRNGNLMVLGVPATSSGNRRQPVNPVLTPEEVWQIDNKMDDGAPDGGVVLVGNGANLPDCHVLEDGARVYNVAHGSVACNIVFRFGI